MSASVMITADKPDRLGRLVNKLGEHVNYRIDITVTDVTQGGAAIIEERARVMADHNYTPEHDAEHHTPATLLFWASQFGMAARHKTVNTGLRRADFFGVPWDVPYDKPASYYATVAGQLTAAALDLLIEEENAR